MDAGARDSMVLQFGATVGRAFDPMQNFSAYWKLRSIYEPRLRGEYEAEGLRMPRLLWRAFWRRVFPLAAPSEAGPFLDLLWALSTDVTEDVDIHAMERLQEDANNFWEWEGPPGSGKSSCMMTKADRYAPIDPGRLEARLTFERPRLTAMLRSMAPDEYGFLDEQRRLGGEGAKTTEDELANIEDEFRASRKNLFVASPKAREHQTVQARFTAFAWKPKTGPSVFLVSSEGTMLGHTVVPWAPKPIWDAYVPLKMAYVAKATAAKVTDGADYARIVNETASDDRCVSFLAGEGRKPKLRDFETAIGAYYGPAVPARRLGKVVGIFQRVCYNWERYQAGLFKEQFGIDPHPNLGLIAKVCYKER